MSRSLTVTAQATDKLSLQQEWVSGEGDDGLEFSLTCGAGLGGSTLRLTITKGDVRITESIDIRKVVEAWVKQIEREIKEAQS